VNNFWQKLPKNFSVLSPMEDVTDVVFREIINECGRPDVFVTEFTNCSGVQSVGGARVIHRLKYFETQRPIVAQVWGITPEDYLKTAKLIVDLGFDGIDINMGCPVPRVIKQGACSALMKNPTLAKEIVMATKEGLAGKIPLSIKTRIGFKTIDTQNWIGFLLKECRPHALTIHGRTVAELSKVPVHYEEIGKAVDINNQLFPLIREQEGTDAFKTVIIANGDILTLDQGRALASQYSFDGMMLGRAIFSNPYLFNPDITQYRPRATGRGNPSLAQVSEGSLFNTKTNLPITPQDRINLVLRHLDLWEKTWGETKPYQILKKYFKIYISGFAGSSDLRQKLMETKTIEEARGVLVDYNSIGESAFGIPK